MKKEENTNLNTAEAGVACMAVAEVTLILTPAIGWCVDIPLSLSAGVAVEVGACFSNICLFSVFIFVIFVSMSMYVCMYIQSTQNAVNLT